MGFVILIQIPIDMVRIQLDYDRFWFSLQNFD